MKQNIYNKKKIKIQKQKQAYKKTPNKTKTNNCKTCAFHLLP